jgi:AcrR family transcriptional regulator
MFPRNPRRDGRAADLKGTARSRLLDAALVELSERGYEAASLQSIARRAGLTTGAVYWNFDNKDGLFAALVEERLLAPQRALVEFARTATAETATAPIISAAVSGLARERPELFLLLFEDWARAARNPDRRDAYVHRYTRLKDALAAALQSRNDTTGVPLTYPANRLATAMFALANGLAMEAIVNPDAVDDDLLGEILQLLYEGNAARARNGGGSQGDEGS